MEDQDQLLEDLFNKYIEDMEVSGIPSWYLDLHYGGGNPLPNNTQTKSQSNQDDTLGMPF